MNAKNSKKAVMSDQQLDDVLKKARIPERPAKYWRRFPSHVMKQLPIRPRAGAKRQQSSS
jgi:hypothetical protein